VVITLEQPFACDSQKFRVYNKKPRRKKEDMRKRKNENDRVINYGRKENIEVTSNRWKGTKERREDRATLWVVSRLCGKKIDV